jgi:uncharacterized RDD family membrane protein YckC
MTIEQNPFEAPKHQADIPTLVESAPLDRFGLASRWQRLAASFVDTFLLIGALVPLFVAITYDLGGINEWLAAAKENLAYSIILETINLLILITIHLAINGYLLATAGQTVGKWLLGIRIVTNQGKLLPLKHLMILRYLSVWVISIPPVLGNFFAFANCLAIFRSSKKCIHDDWAGTKVVRTNPS